MRRLVPLLTASLLATATIRAGAQVLGLPVVNNGVPTGLAFAADVGFANEDAGKGKAIGAHAAFGIGLLGLTASVARFDPKNDDAIISAGLSATLRLFGGPLMPFRVLLQGGVAHWRQDLASIEGPVTAKTTRVPVSLGFAATIPNPAFAIKPWLAPRIDIFRTSFDGGLEAGSYTDSDFAIAGGIDVSMLNGLTLRAAYDRIFRDGGKPSILSIGVGFAP
ncbi:MAG: hypothetical protein H0W15_02185 [Gemmatimonadales bacterium]|nr:hypothetical protein [Gemmatimonadales bacterium]